MLKFYCHVKKVWQNTLCIHKVCREAEYKMPKERKNASNL